MDIKVIKFENYCCPVRAHYNDSGADCYSAVNIDIPAHSVAIVPTGVGVCLPDGYDLVVYCKSGLSKKGIWAANAPVDSGYRGEIHTILYNTTSDSYHINKGEKIGQFVVRPVIYANFVEDLGENRKNGAFGSTGA